MPTSDVTFIEDILAARPSLLDTDATDGEVMIIGIMDNASIKQLAEYVRDQLAEDAELDNDERFAAAPSTRH